ncbi:hypothetical protein ACP70R_003546 [Stipagrostis hirtigluma subsp. patula]
MASTPSLTPTPTVVKRGFPNHPVVAAFPFAGKASTAARDSLFTGPAFSSFESLASGELDAPSALALEARSSPPCQ